MHLSHPIESSIIIPVYNQWKFTCMCLEALYNTLEGKNCEIIVIDNASTDATPVRCPVLGKKLFGSLFHYHRAERNLNFGPASNLGAQKAKGEFLIFLNNDTVPLPGWYEPLIKDFTVYSDIACTGPVLLYPEEGPLGRTVQHLGVVMSQSRTVKHLYEGIPEASPLTAKRRFFQMITGACMVIRRSLFCETGLFDERYINGCEDLDLCLHLWNKGYRMTINPASRIIHHTSQTPGRFTHDQKNFQLLTETFLSTATPDWHIHLHNDRLTIKLTPWQIPIAAYSQEQAKALTHLFANTNGQEELRNRLIDFPFWEEGYQSLATILANQGEDTRLLEITQDKLFRNQEYILARYLRACAEQDEARQEPLLGNLLRLCVPFEYYVYTAQTERIALKKLGLDSLAGEYANWLKNKDIFRDKHYFPLMYALWKSRHNPQKTHEIPFELYTAGGYAKSSTKSATFDREYYTRQRPEFTSISQDSFIHYILRGKAEGALHHKPQTLMRAHDGTRQELHDTAIGNDRCQVIAWYLPQFHPIAENDVAWSKGFTEWTNVVAAKPRFDGHYQPRLPGALGFYDLRRKETLEEQIALAKHAGIYGFCLHHYWFHGHTLMRTPLEHLRNNPSIDFPFCLHWANEPWTRRWDGSENDVIINQQHSPEDDIDFIKDIEWALRDKRYIRFQGKPVLGIYRCNLFPNIHETIARLRNYCLSCGIGEIFLFGSQSFSNSPAKILDTGFDGVVEYPPYGCAIPPINNEFEDKSLQYFGDIRRYTDARDTYLNANDTVYTRPIFRSVMPGWDNSSKRPYNGQLFVDSTPNAYANWLKTTLERATKDSYEGEKYVFINAWNEWAESAYLEPDAKYGAAVLNATARAIDTAGSLPHVLFVCNPENTQHADWLENTLTANAQSPCFRPVILSPEPVHSIGTFKGLAPLIPSFAHASSQEITQLIRQNGYFTFSLSVILQDIPWQHREGIASLSQELLILESTSGHSMADSGKGFWHVNKNSASFMDWSLENRSTQETRTLRLLLERAAQKLSDTVDISVIFLFPETKDISLQALTEAYANSSLVLETFVPQPLVQLCANIVPNLLGVPAPDETSYLRSALFMARGRAVWLLKPDTAIDAYIPQALYAPLMEDGIVTARPAFPPHIDCLPEPMENNTLMLPGEEVIHVAAKKHKAVLPQISAALFKRDDLLRALAGVGAGPFDSARAIRAVYQAGNVALVPYLHKA